MNAPTVWIVLPALISVATYFLRGRDKFITFVGVAVAVLLALLAWLAPIGEVINLGLWSVKLTGSLTVLGRRFVLDASKATILVLMYLGIAFWFGGSIVARTTRLFVPGGLMIASLLTAALAVEPLLYAALLIEMAVLVSIPVLVTPGKSVGKGVLRYLTFQTLGMPFILFTGWMLAGVESSPGDSELVLHASILMGFGFAFLLAIFPFHTWIPMIAEEVHPYVAAFILFILPLVVILFGLRFLDRYVWLRSSSGVYSLLRYTGSIMVIAGGFWAAFESHLGRIMGFAVMIGIGLLLMTLGVGLDVAESKLLLGLFLALILPLGLGLGVWALALTAIAGAGRTDITPSDDLSFQNVQGVARHLPVAVGGLILANLTLAGFPLLAGFPPRLALWNNLIQDYPLTALATLFGSTGLMIACLRTMAILVKVPKDEQWEMKETIGEKLLLVVGGMMLLVSGIFPQLLISAFTRLSDIFLHISL